MKLLALLFIAGLLVAGCVQPSPKPGVSVTATPFATPALAASPTAQGTQSAGIAATPTAKPPSLDPNKIIILQPGLLKQGDLKDYWQKENDFGVRLTPLSEQVFQNCWLFKYNETGKSNAFLCFPQPTTDPDGKRSFDRASEGAYSVLPTNQTNYGLTVEGGWPHVTIALWGYSNIQDAKDDYQSKFSSDIANQGAVVHKEDSPNVGNEVVSASLGCAHFTILFRRNNVVEQMYMFTGSAYSGELISGECTTLEQKDELRGYAGLMDERLLNIGNA